MQPFCSFYCSFTHSPDHFCVIIFAIRNLIPLAFCDAYGMAHIPMDCHSMQLRSLLLSYCLHCTAQLCYCCNCCVIFYIHLESFAWSGRTSNIKCFFFPKWECESKWIDDFRVKCTPECIETIGLKRKNEHQRQTNEEKKSASTVFMRERKADRKTATEREKIKRLWMNEWKYKRTHSEEQ